MSKKETTFKETYEWLLNNGWCRITAKEYNKEKKIKKYYTARIGKWAFFRLKKSIKEIGLENGE